MQSNPIDPSESTLSPAERREDMRLALDQCRAGTLTLFEDLDRAEFCEQVHPEFSPLGWHLGHIAYTEALWLLCELGGRSLPRPELKPVFAVDGRPKHERGDLPAAEAVIDYLGDIRSAVWDELDGWAPESQEHIWQFVLQHEAQHSETIAFLRQLQTGCGPGKPESTRIEDEWVAIPAGPAVIGNDGVTALDNERGRHRVHVGDFRIGRYPVTQAQYARFMQEGGYQKQDWWTDDGWAWLGRAQVDGPLYWHEGGDAHPVSGVSAHEAEAFCRYAGARLPTEQEWEKAAAWQDTPDLDGDGRWSPYPWGDAAADGDTNSDRHWGSTSPVTAHPGGRSASGGEDFLGNVWEWTASTFEAYPGFASFPYDGFSGVYFDGRHRVLRGGSWATRPWVLRNSVRNWYLPETRQILSGFRLARDGLIDP